MLGMHSCRSPGWEASMGLKCLSAQLAHSICSPHAKLQLGHVHALNTCLATLIATLALQRITS